MSAMAKRWYVVHTYSGHENKVKNYIESAIKGDDSSNSLKDRISRVVVPTEEVVEMRNGKKMASQRKFLPSYVLVEMEITRETEYFVTNVPGVTSFVGPGRKPQPLRDDEVERILGQVDRERAQEVQKVPFHAGDKVKIVDGPFTDFTGTVEEINLEKSKLRVMVTIFGRATPVELDILQVESLPAG